MFNLNTLEPIYMQVAQALHDNSAIIVARVDCTKWPKVGAHFSVQGYPTIKFIRGEKVVEFSGDRTKEELVDFADRLSG